MSLFCDSLLKGGGWKVWVGEKKDVFNEVTVNLGLEAVNWKDREGWGDASAMMRGGPLQLIQSLLSH